MHTPHSTYLSSRSSAPLVGLRWGLALLLVGSLCLLPSSALGQPEFPGTPDTTSTNVRVYLSDLYGPRSGPGIGIGGVVHNLTRTHDQWLLTAAPALYEQVATLSFASANPQRARQYVLVHLRGLHTDRDWVAGRGNTRLGVERSSLHGRVRAGQAFLDHRLVVQPHVGISSHSIDGVTGLGARPARPTAALPSPGTRQTGLRPGLDLQFDTRDERLQATSGVLLQGTWAQYVSLDATPLRFDQAEIDAYGYLPLGGPHRLAVRLSGMTTQSRGDAPVPIYMLPRLGGEQVPGLARGQFVGNDRLISSLLYRFPLKRILGFPAIEGHLGVHAARTYDDLQTQFSPTLSFEDAPDSNGDARPLRPAASAGLRFVVPARDRPTLELALGVSPSGVSGVRFSFVRSLQTIRPPHHTLDHLW